MLPPKRLHNLDYLRGLSALGIMLYHYLTWTYGKYNADSVLGRIGVYGVSVFYVLSGLTLFHVYYPYMQPTRANLLVFFKKRALRILPLLWLATVATLLLSGNWPGSGILFLNLTGLFGFFNWDAYIAGGAWSIGNELVFYALFPVFLSLFKKNTFYVFFIPLLFFAAYLAFAFFILPESRVQDQWRNYIHPLNQAFLFLGGFLIGYVLQKKTIGPSLLWAVLLSCLILFVFYPVHGPQMALKMGFPRLVFTACCFMVCFALYALPPVLPSLLKTPFLRLGEISYSVYLLHPLVYDVVGRFRMHVMPISIQERLGYSICLSLILSYGVYRFFERPILRLN